MYHTHSTPNYTHVVRTAESNAEFWAFVATHPELTIEQARQVRNTAAIRGWRWDWDLMHWV